jgi:Na+-transporting methylmalonyl-CoA/oxaloacetate decarboxylase gamma subunit
VSYENPAELAYDDQMLAGVVAKLNRLVKKAVGEDHGPEKVTALASQLHEKQSPARLAVIAAVAVHQLAQAKQ